MGDGQNRTRTSLPVAVEKFTEVFEVDIEPSLLDDDLAHLKLTRACTRFPGDPNSEHDTDREQYRAHDRDHFVPARRKDDARRNTGRCSGAAHECV